VGPLKMAVGTAMGASGVLPSFLVFPFHKVGVRVNVREVFDAIGVVLDLSVVPGRNSALVTASGSGGPP
jgi:hypothetical protein